MWRTRLEKHVDLFLPTKSPMERRQGGVREGGWPTEADKNDSFIYLDGYEWSFNPHLSCWEQPRLVWKACLSCGSRNRSQSNVKWVLPFVQKDPPKFCFPSGVAPAPCVWRMVLLWHFDWTPSWELHNSHHALSLYTLHLLLHNLSAPRDEGYCRDKTPVSLLGNSGTSAQMSWKVSAGLVKYPWYLLAFFPVKWQGVTSPSTMPATWRDRVVAIFPMLMNIYPHTLSWFLRIEILINIFVSLCFFCCSFVTAFMFS